MKQIVRESQLTEQITGKSFSEELIFASTNPQYDNIVHWIANSVHENSKLRTYCVHKLFWMSKPRCTILLHLVLITLLVRWGQIYSKLASAQKPNI